MATTFGPVQMRLVVHTDDLDARRATLELINTA